MLIEANAKPCMYTMYVKQKITSGVSLSHRNKPVCDKVTANTLIVCPVGLTAGRAIWLLLE